MDLSGFIDGYYSFNANRPNTSDGYDQINQLYNFNDETDRFELSTAKLTLNHDPDPMGAHVDFIYGRINDLINAAPPNSDGAEQLPYIEQAFLSLTPRRAKGFDFDFGKFLTSAGVEVPESKDNWNYSRSLLYALAIPYWHFGARASLPVSKTETIGFQLVNGWNNVSRTNRGVTGIFASAYTKPKFAWDLNYIVGPENPNTTDGLRNLVDTTLLLTPPGKFNAYINYDYGQNQDSPASQGNAILKTWQGVAGAFHEQVAGIQSFAGRFEWFNDPQGFTTGASQHLYEFTGTYEYKWGAGMLMRIEYRCDVSNKNYFNKLADQTTDQQQTVTLAYIAFFGPHR